MTERNLRKRVKGVVTSDKMEKTITVKASHLVLHPRLRKHIKRDSVFKAHDERNEAQKGDLVEIARARPLSKTKFWKLVRVLRTASDLGAGLEPAAELAAEVTSLNLPSPSSPPEGKEETEAADSPEGDLPPEDPQENKTVE